MRGLLLFVAVASSVLVAGVLAMGCGEYIFDGGRNCTAEELAEFGCGYCPVTCSRLDGGVDAALDEDADVTCNGQCVPSLPVGWDGPLLLWTGPGPEIPMCPPQARGESGGTWFGDLQAPLASCGTCDCEPPVGSCTLPSTLTTSSAICPGSASGSAHISFDAPSAWNGACSSMDAIPAGELCGGSPCVKSITIAPLNVTEGTCTPVSSAAPKPPEPTSWGIVSAVCPGTTSGSCNRSDLTCMPVDEPGFQRCVSQRGDSPCPSGHYYTERHVLYTGVNDTRGCAPCTCGETVGSTCSAMISLYKDAACQVPVELGLSIDATGPGCFDILPAGSALGSKSAGPAIYTPGVCQPAGGGATGAAEPIDPTTFCCAPLP